MLLFGWRALAISLVARNLLPPNLSCTRGWGSGLGKGFLAFSPSLCLQALSMLATSPQKFRTFTAQQGPSAPGTQWPRTQSCRCLQLCKLTVNPTVSSPGWCHSRRSQWGASQYPVVTAGPWAHPRQSLLSTTSPSVHFAHGYLGSPDAVVPLSRPPQRPRPGAKTVSNARVRGSVTRVEEQSGWRSTNVLLFVQLRHEPRARLSWINPFNPQ